MLKRLESIVSLFARITTGVLFVAAVFINVFYGNDCDIEVKLLWQILLVSGVCALGALILPFDAKREVSKYSMLICMLIYYFFVNVVVLLSGFYFEWFYIDNWKQVLGMVVAIAFVFVVVTLITYHAEYQVAEKMNRKLQERN